ncbi:uncharacterized protein VP01_2854g1 [Puccinia sorghi]|uniref:DUF659 domain-containing protein n=1 Tax=Puccinia sorghi TaxID=27349 RepID=A0A0L6V214_9BASI|nr:uncharacterized protein VP01_2854g1 [Puccinia sorghi]
MGIISHFIDWKFKIIDLTISISHVQALWNKLHQFLYDVLQNYGCLDMFHTLTITNASTNGKMAHKAKSIIPHFYTKTHLLGCIAHVITLGKNEDFLF